ncbi:hypothetical protein ABZX51_004701 [Aspergillus tubingensis]
MTVAKWDSDICSRAHSGYARKYSLNRRDIRPLCSFRQLSNVWERHGEDLPRTGKYMFGLWLAGELGEASTANGRSSPGRQPPLARYGIGNEIGSTKPNLQEKRDEVNPKCTQKPAPTGLSMQG